MIQTKTKSAIGMEEIVAIQMRQWTIAMNVFVLITRKADQNILKTRNCTTFLCNSNIFSQAVLGNGFVILKVFSHVDFGQGEKLKLV